MRYHLDFYHYDMFPWDRDGLELPSQHGTIKDAEDRMRAVWDLGAYKEDPHLAGWRLEDKTAGKSWWYSFDRSGQLNNYLVWSVE